MFHRICRLAHPTSIEHVIKTPAPLSIECRRSFCAQIQQQSHHVAKSKKICFVFGGMGSQYVGMCKDLAEEYSYIASFLKDCDDYLLDIQQPPSGVKLTDMMFNSDKKTQAEVINGCNATAVHAICIWKILEKEYGIHSLFNHEHNVLETTIMGHSIGEHPAMYAAGLFKSDEDELWICQRFGECMRDCTIPGQAMAAVVSNPKDVDKNLLDMMPQVDRVCAECNVSLANINSHTQLVFSGYREDIGTAVTMLNAKELFDGKLRHLYLDIGGAYHSHLMQGTKERYYDYWHSLDLNEQLRCNVYLNGLGNRYEGKDSIRNLLAQQLYSRVYWHDCVKNYMDNTTKGGQEEDFEHIFIEIGPKKVCAKLIDQIVKYLGYDQRHSIRTMNITNAKTLSLIESVL